MKQRYPEPDDWFRVRFSDEIHFCYGPQGKLHIICKPGKQYCPNCIQEDKEPEEKDKKRYHCSAAVGHDFKSDMCFYEVPGNINGKMSQRVYSDLSAIVKPWIEAHHNFVLEKDGDSGHEPGKSNIVRTWKESNGLEIYFNCHSLPELSPIENCWQPVKQHLHKYPNWELG